MRLPACYSKSRDLDEVFCVCGCSHNSLETIFNLLITVYIGFLRFATYLYQLMVKIMLNFVNSHNSPLRLANFFCQIGWSFLPLWGATKPEKAKVCALPSWKTYQSRIPTAHEINDWFVIKEHQALGIVLGSVSNLVVLDIDDLQRAQTFIELCPDLTETFTVQSGYRQLPHYYFHLPSDLNVTSRHKNNVELRSDGQYVVAPNTQINDHVWKITNTQKPRTLTERDLRRILAFMGCIPHLNSTKRKKRHTAQNNDNVVDVGQAISNTISPVQLLRRYHALAHDGGRNNALFDVARLARDCGWSQARLEDVMVMAHEQQQTTQIHVRESRSQRRTEALATIASVYSREAQVRPKIEKQPFEQLPNAIREKLLQHKLDNVARVLDGLLMAGFKAGQVFSASDVYSAIGHFGIGRNTVYETLKASVNDNLLFASTSSPEPPTPSANAVNRFALITNQCLIGRVAKAGKIRGRKKQMVVMPSIDELCKRLGITGANVTSGDILPESALASPRAYRQALHTALIKRAPGQYSRKWQSERLGVSKDSLRRYEKRANVIVQAMYKSWKLGWQDLKNVVPDELINGHFVEDERGKRYPPILSLIHKLLARGKCLVYKVQVSNFYAMPIVQEIHNVSHSHLKDNTNKQVDIPLHIASFMPSPNVTTGDTSNQDTVPRRADLDIGQSNHAIDLLPTKTSQTPNVTTGDTLLDETDNREKQALANQLYDTLRLMNPKHSLTRGHVKRLIDQYDFHVIERGLKVISKKPNLYNPAGFFLVWLRAQKWANDDKSKPDLKSAQAIEKPVNQSDVIDEKRASHDTWLQRLKDSAYVDYFMNADQIVDA